MDKTMVELFAGVGGFRLGMERLGSGWNTVWFSQWEPGKKVQYAHDCYVSHFGEAVDLNGEIHTGEDISAIDKTSIPDHTLLVGGFPCQNYSIATPLPKAKGIEGEKGILWWQIYNTIVAKKPAFCLFENVDRLLKSPASQRGKDFGIILGCLNNLGYSVEWRVVNASLYGASQKRTRVFIFAWRNDTGYAKTVSNIETEELLLRSGFMAKAFPVLQTGKTINQTKISQDLVGISKSFRFPFKKAGIMKNGTVYTTDIEEKTEPSVTLGEILEKDAGEKYYIKEEAVNRWKYLKGAKKIERTSKNGHVYTYAEGPIAFPDRLDRPGRTMLTSETTLNRSSHLIKDPQTGRFRVLTPIEAERLQGFDDDWTKAGGMPERMRYFCMGNALVVPMITRMGKVLDEIIRKEP